MSLHEEKFAENGHSGTSIPSWLITAIIWALTMIFAAGVGWQAFATKDWAEQRDQRTREELRQDYRRDVDEIKQYLQRIERKLDNKVDKPERNR